MHRILPLDDFDRTNKRVSYSFFGIVALILKLAFEKLWPIKISGLLFFELTTLFGSFQGRDIYIRKPYNCVIRN